MMHSTMRWWVAIPLMMVMAVVGCGGDDGAGVDGSEADTGVTPAITADAASDPSGNAGEDATRAEDAAGSAAGVIILGGDEIAVGGLLCYFQEQPRAGLGGVFTHTAQGRGTNAEGESIVLDLSRARAEDGTVGDLIIVNIGDPRDEDSVSLSASGPEGLIEFGDASASASGVGVSDFGADPVSVSFDLACS